MKITLIQNNPQFGQKASNIDNLFSMIDVEQSDLYILPELAYTGYQFSSKQEAFSLADEKDSDTISRFTQKSKEINGAIVFGFAEKEGDRLFNSAMMVTPDGDRHIYRKNHLFYREKEIFEPGNGFAVHEFRGVNIGMAICFDWIFPESFRTLALMGADLIAHAANLVMPYCQQADFARAVENQIYIATANRIGTESRTDESLTFTGESVLVSPKGDYLLRGDKDGENVLSAEIDPTLARNKSLNPFNNIMDDRRPDIYS